MHPNAELLTRFYTALNAHDGEGMAACYHPDVHFSDPVFPDLSGERAKGMWKMLTKRASDLKVEFDGIEADDATGKAHWVATYSWSGTGRTVVNDIQATFRFKDGLIVDHQDVFDLYKWTRMALGLQGTLLGWTPMVQGKIRDQANKGLDKFMAG